MKVLGVKQFHQKTYKLLNLKGNEFEGLLGKVPKNFVSVIYGFSGNGKTEFTVRLVKALAQLGLKTAWLSYEQGHGYDFQMATKRNQMEEVNGYFYPIDPVTDRKPGVSYLEELVSYLTTSTGKIKRSAPDVIVIDSLDYTGFTWDDYIMLKERFGHCKIFLFIAHSSKTGRLNKTISERIVFDGGMGIFVSKYIAHPEKNRYGGFESYVVWEQKAREMNPAFFGKRVKENKPKKS